MQQNLHASDVSVSSMLPVLALKVYLVPGVSDVHSTGAPDVTG